MCAACGVRGGFCRSVLCVGVDVGVSFLFLGAEVRRATQWIVIFGFVWVVVLIEN